MRGVCVNGLERGGLGGCGGAEESQSPEQSQIISATRERSRRIGVTAVTPTRFTGQPGRGGDSGILTSRLRSLWAPLLCFTKGGVDLREQARTKATGYPRCYPIQQVETAIGGERPVRPFHVPDHRTGSR
jgi:hypothetical protein